MARFAFEKPEQLIDFAYRSHHETAVQAKALVEAFYGKPAERSYFIGCSSGGYEGLMEAQRFPADYDGIVAGAPANNWTRLMAGDFDGVLAVLKDPASHLPLSALGLLHRGVLAACDGADGVSDGVLEDPRQCRFDPGQLACPDNQPAATCLTRAQVEAARRVYGGLKDPRTGAQLYPGLAPGSEPFWPHRDPPIPFPSRSPITNGWSSAIRTGTGRRSISRSGRLRGAPESGGEVRADPQCHQPDLRAFRDRGGKLLQYHGWNDQLISGAEQHRLLRERAVVLQDPPRTCRASIGSSWRRGWRIAAAERARTRSTCRPRSSNGWNVAWPPIRSSRRAQSTASSIDCARCVRTRRRRSTRARETRTRRGEFRLSLVHRPHNAIGLEPAEPSASANRRTREYQRRVFIFSSTSPSFLISSP